MHRPVKLIPPKQTQITSLFSKAGENLRDLPELLDPKYALNIQNYYITSDGGLEKRGGSSQEFTVAGGYPILSVEKWTDDLYVYCYNKTLAVFRKSTSAHSIVKSNFVTAQFDTKRYGDYIFVASPEDKIGRLTMTLDYDGQTGNFTAGLVVTGTTSGATGIILSDNDAGATGTLTLGSVTGTFINNEPITDTSTGAAVVDGTLDFTYTTISAAPMAEVIEVIGARLFAGGLSSDKTAVQYSEIDSGSNPPFNTWSNTTTSTDGGKVFWRGAGKVTSVKSLGNVNVVFAENGKWGFTIDIADSNGTLKKVDNIVIDRKDFGGSRGAIVTPKGLFYANEGGLWQLISLGQPNIPYSDQESKTSILLGTKYFDDVDLSNADIAFDKEKDTILVSCAKDADFNNFVIAYNVVQQSFSHFTGWSVSRFLDDNGVLYGGSAIDTTLNKLFEGYADNGKDIWTEFKTELRGGDLDTRQDLLGTYVKGKFSLSTELKIHYDIFDKTGTFIEDKMIQTWTVSSEDTIVGWGQSGWGQEGFGGAGTVENQVENFSGARNKIANFQRLQIRIKGNDQLFHSLNWLRVLVKKSIPIRRRNLVKL